MMNVKYGDIIMRKADKACYLVTYVPSPVKNKFIKSFRESEKDTMVVCINPASGDPTKVGGVTAGKMFTTLSELGSLDNAEVVGNLQTMVKTIVSAHK